MLTANIRKIKQSVMPIIIFILNEVSENEIVFFVWMGLFF